jgi:multiple antibiotic resistance protein
VVSVTLGVGHSSDQILKVFGISLDAFSVAGGGVLIFIGLSMLRGSSSPSTPDALGDGSGDINRFGRLILFAASPGTITGVITIVAAHRREGIPVTALVAIAAVLGATWILLLVTSAMGRGKTHPSLARDMVSRYMGLIIVAMGIQFALDGYRSFMSG